MAKTKVKIKSLKIESLQQLVVVDCNPKFPEIVILPDETPKTSSSFVWKAATPNQQQDSTRRQESILLPTPCCFAVWINCQIIYSCSSLICGACQDNMVCRLFTCAALTIRYRIEGLFVHGRLKTPNSSVLKRLSLTHDGLGRPIPIDLVLILVTRARRSDDPIKNSVLHLQSFHCATQMSSSDRSCNNLRAAVTK